MEKDKTDILKFKRDKLEITGPDSSINNNLSAKGQPITSVAPMSDRLPPERRVGGEYHELSTQVARLNGEMQILKSRLNTLVDFYEMKVDAIYRTVSDVLPTMIRSGKLVVPSDRADDRSKSISDFVKMDVDAWAKEIAATASGYLEQGVYRAPLIFAGFKFHPNVSVHPEYVNVPGAINGIAMYGPYKKLLPGSYIVECYVTSNSDPNGPNDPLDIELDVFDATKDVVMICNSIVKSFADSKVHMLSVSFHCDPDRSESLFELRLHQKGVSSFRLNKLHLVHNGN